jgi:Mn2+/Fe2+ NRAMP family transporter
MRTAMLYIMIGIFGVAGTVFLALAVVTFIDATRQSQTTESAWLMGPFWLVVSTSTSLWIAALATLCFIVALLAFIANTLADAVERPHVAQLAPRTAVLPEQSGAPWYTQTSVKEG